MERPGRWLAGFVRARWDRLRARDGRWPRVLVLAA